MTDISHEPETNVGVSGPRLSTAALVTLGAAALAGICGLLFHGILGWILVVVVSLAAAYVAASISRPASAEDQTRTRELCAALDRGRPLEPTPPSGYARDWAALYERLSRLTFEAQGHAEALADLERFQSQAELAVSLIHEGKDPLTEVAELRVGPLRALLEAVKDSAARGPVVSRLSLGEEELIGSDDELPPDWPKGVPAPSALTPKDWTEVRTGLRNLVHGFDELLESWGVGDSPATASSEEAGSRTPAQLVDAVVVTAADGIEDLAAGLMRANELASVAERVTNRATLLALNAALEATRSGSEAFAAIAEETRRLAEFSREATDTISRLSSEIEYKVGETITAIHATSEDAKTSLADPAPGAAAPRMSSVTRSRVEALRQRARTILRELDEAAQRPAHDAQGQAHDTQDSAQDAQGPDTRPSADSDGGPSAAGSDFGDSPRESEEPQEEVEKAPRTADTLSTEGILLIEGLKPDARLES